MKPFIFLTLLLYTIMASASAQTPPNILMADLAKKWEGNKTYTLAVIEAMPAEHFDFKPMEEMKSFKDQVSHIVGTLAFKMEKLGHKGISDLDTENKASILSSFALIFDEIIAHINTLNDSFLTEDIEMWYGESSKSRLFNLMDNHVAHHRGQLIVYLRLKGITPPKYIGW